LKTNNWDASKVTFAADHAIRRQGSSDTSVDTALPDKDLLHSKLIVRLDFISDTPTG